MPEIEEDLVQQREEVRFHILEFKYIAWLKNLIMYMCETDNN